MYCISDLGPSWPPYYGYKKLGFEDLCQFRSRYYVRLDYFIGNKLLGSRLNTNFSRSKTVENITYCVSDHAPEGVLSQLPATSHEGKIESIKDINNLLWKGSHPSAHYVYAYALNTRGELQSLYWLKTSDGMTYNMGLHFAQDNKMAKRLFRYFVRVCKASAVAAWSFALDANDQQLLKTLRMFKIPFINTIRKNPPVIVRSLKTKEDGSIDWMINGLDIRKPENWIINKYDGDSF